MDRSQELANTNIEEIGKVPSAMTSDPEQTERRAVSRHPCLLRVLVAPFDGNEVPTERMFQEVPCHNLSTRGIAFLWPDAPVFEFVVVGLGALQNPTYLTARVAHCTSHGDGTGEFKFLVGCSFGGRISISP